MSVSRDLHPVPDVDELDQAELLRAILVELQRLNGTLLPLAEAAKKRMPFTFGLRS